VNALTDAKRILSRRDLDFLINEWLKADELTTRPRFAEHSPQTFAAALDLAEQLATRYFAPHNALADRTEPAFDGQRVQLVPEIGRALTAFAESGLISAAMDDEIGGGQLPHTVHRACFAWLQAANISTASYAMLTMANANLLRTYGSQEQIDSYVLPMLEGRYTGTMCLSETQAGSSLADVTTRAEPEPGGDGADGRYRVFGSKMWISGGDHELAENIVHLVLARAAGSPAGVKGLSLFLVPKFLPSPDGGPPMRNDVALVGLNHKMGYRGTVNTVLDFGSGTFQPDQAPGAIGYLVGQLDQGLPAMFHMMNEARIAVGAGAAALGYTGYLHALDYARTRLQGRPADAKDPSAPQVPIITHPDVRRMLLAAKCYAEGGLALTLFAARLLDEQASAEDQQQARESSLLLDVLTPIVKSWPSQWCLAANDLAIQIHGGYGYTREFGVEQFYRDNRLNPIHEGTTGIQAIDLLGRKVRLENGAGFALLISRITGTAAAAPESWRAEATELSSAAGRLSEVTATLWRDGAAAGVLANASVYLEAAGHVVVAWIWLQQAIATQERPGSFYEGKRAAARYFFRYELPRTGPQLDLLATGDTMLLDLDDQCL
jgi:alkylation response protein AidB-like acyl-CoA dehydrogenase